MKTVKFKTLSTFIFTYVLSPKRRITVWMRKGKQGFVRALYPNVVSMRRAQAHLCMSQYWADLDFVEKFHTLVCQLKSGPELPENSVLY